MTAWNPDAPLAGARERSMSLFNSQKQRRGGAATPVRRRPGIDFSITGLAYCAMMLFMGAAAVNTQANLLFGVFGLMIGIFLVSHFIAGLVLRKLQVHRVIPEHGTVASPMPLTYEFTNTKRYWPSLSVTLAEMDGVEGFTTQPHCYLLHAAPGMTASVPVEFIPKRRGLHGLNQYQLGTSFPFGFIKRAVNRSRKDMVLVFPPLAPVDRRLLSMCRSADNAGATMRPKPGGMDEFYGVKEYRAGENRRHIYWRRSARTGVMVSKLMTQAAPPRVLLLVDTYVKERSLEEHALVERSIAMAGSLASQTLDEGLSVGLFVFSDGWVGVHPTRGKRQRDELLTILARLPLNQSHDTQSLLDECYSFLESGTTPVLFTPRDVQMGLIERARGLMVVASASSPAARAWFKFDPSIDFAACMPPDQRPTIDPKDPASRQAPVDKPPAEPLKEAV